MLHERCGNAARRVADFISRKRIRAFTYAHDTAGSFSLVTERDPCRFPNPV
jgi:hypothetical protein